MDNFKFALGAPTLYWCWTERQASDAYTLFYETCQTTDLTEDMIRHYPLLSALYTTESEPGI